MPITLNGDTGIVSPAIDVTTPITVADGGTGLSSPGTSGNILTSNGTAWTSAAAPAGGFGNMEVFTSSGTFTVPAGITKAKVTVVGGGGGGSNGAPTNGGTGGTSSFGAFCSATGGIGFWNPGSVGNAGGSGSGGNLNLEGSRGFAVGQRGLSFYGLSYGGGGQGSTSGGSWGAGGGGGGAIELVTGLTPGGTVSVTVGAGGTAASGAGAGTAGVVIVEY